MKLKTNFFSKSIATAIALTSVSLSTTLLAVETKVSGFLALDLMKAKSIDSTQTYKKGSGNSATYPLSNENDEWSYNTGVGSLDLKINAKQDKVAGHIKLDLDDSSIGTKYNIFEEAIIKYYYSDLIKFEAGKGKVQFSLQHRGTIEASYIDGGSLLDTMIFWRDQDNKDLLSVTIGNKDRGFFNHFTAYGNKFQDKSHDVKTVNGYADRLELLIEDLTLSVAGAYILDNTPPSEGKYYRGTNWAVDFGGNYKFSSGEIFFEYQNGHMKTNLDYNYGSPRSTEHVFQLGNDINITETLSIVSDLEYATVEFIGNNNCGYYGTSCTNRKIERDTWKVEVGPVFELEKGFQVAFGLLYEEGQSKVENIEQPKEKAIQLATTTSFWF